MLIDVTEQRQLQDQLRQLAYFDGLTQLYNRTQFVHRGRDLLQQAEASQEAISIILFDTDFFKSINDTYGHETGDQAIIHVVDVCKGVLEPSMLFGRYGGEEFVLALPGFALEEAVGLAERIQTALAAQPLPSSRAPIAITCSFGVAERVKPSHTLESLLHEADEALYVSKNNGRNQVSRYPIRESVRSPDIG